MNEPSRLSEDLSEIRAALSSATYLASSEAELAEAVGSVLERSGIDHEVEVDLGPCGRIDVLALGRIGIEIKFRYGISDVLRQLDRYAGCDRLEAMVLATASRRLAAATPGSMRGKEVVRVVLGSGL